MSRGGWRPGGGRPPGIKETKPRRPRKKRGLPVGNAPPVSGGAVLDLEAHDYLRQVWNDPNIEPALRIRAAEIVFRVLGVKKGKKEAASERAKVAGEGRFRSSLPPIKRVK